MAAQLEDLHLADLHARAAAAGVPGYRKLRREELIEALGTSGGDDAAAPGPEAEEAADIGVVVEATVLDAEPSEPVELGTGGSRGR